MSMSVPRSFLEKLVDILKYIYITLINIFMPPNMNSSLVMRPNYERATEYIYHWSTPYILKSQQLGTSVTDLAGDNATRAQFVQAVQNNKLLVMQGHGSETTLTGQHYAPILEMKDEGALLEGTVIYALSCLTGAQLAAYEVANNGVVCYLGYFEPFQFFTTTNSTPLNDPAAAPFFQSSHAFWSALLDGATTGKSYTYSQEEFARNIEEWQQSADASAPFIAAALLWDKDCQELHGAQDATVAVPMITAGVSSTPLLVALGVGAVAWLWSKFRN